MQQVSVFQVLSIQDIVHPGPIDHFQEMYPQTAFEVVLTGLAFGFQFIRLP